MPKAFISILGNNDYLECRHTYNNVVSDIPVKYCQEDLIKFFCKDFSEDDEIRIYLTEDAKNKNWFNNGHKDRDNKVKENIGLQERLKRLNLRSKVIPREIPEGKNELEIWEIFNIIYNDLRNCEEVIVDVTHSFRYLPMLLTILLNFSKYTKGISIDGIYYAAFETLGSIPEVAKIPVEERIVPIFNLTSFSQLQDYTVATFDFINNANLTLLKKAFSKLEKIHTDGNDLIKLQKSVLSKLEDLTQKIALCRGKELIEYNYELLKEMLNNLKEKQSLSSFNILIDNIIQKIEGFNKNPFSLTYTIVDWCLKHNLYQQALTFFQEFLITSVLYDCRLDYHNKDLRELVSKAFRIYAQNIPEDQWQEPARSQKELVKDIIRKESFQKVKDIYQTLIDYRNDVNHAGFLENSRSTEKIKNKIRVLIQSFNQLFNSHAHQLI